MVRKVVLAVAAATLTMAPVAAQAAPDRIASPVSAEAENLESGAWLGIGLFVVAALIFALLYHDSDDDFDPVSP